MMNDKKNILFVDDEPHMLDGLRRALRNQRMKWNMLFVSSAEDALELIHESTLDAVITDITMPGLDGLQMLRIIREEGHSCAVVVLTGQGSESIAVEVMKAGADDYLPKGSATPELMKCTIQKVIDSVEQKKALEKMAAYAARLSEKLAEQNIKLTQLSRFDPLTQLFNRRVWEECIDTEHTRSERNRHPYSVIMIDVDHFKLFNDNRGHPEGDDVLRAIANRIQKVTRTCDVPGRYGGEEFVVLLPETTLLEAHSMAERIRNAVWDLKIPHPTNNRYLRITVSMGVAEGPANGWQSVVKDADIALYASKKNGRNTVTKFREDLKRVEQVVHEESHQHKGAA